MTVIVPSVCLAMFLLVSLLTWLHERAKMKKRVAEHLKNWKPRWPYVPPPDIDWQGTNWTAGSPPQRGDLR